MNTGTQPDLQWLFWRWPRHTYSRGSFQSPNRNLKLTIQWMVHENIVLQQCLIENDGDADVEVDVEFHKSLCIRNLDHFDRESKFNKEGNSNHDIVTGPEGVSCVFIHRLAAGHPSKSTPATSRLRPWNTVGGEDLQVHEEVAPPIVPSSSDSVYKDVFSGSTVPILRQEDESRTRGPLHEDTPSEETLSEDDFSEDSLSDDSNSSTGSRPAEIRASKYNPQDDEVDSKSAHEIAVISAVTIDGKVQPFEAEPGPQQWSFVVKGRHMPGLGGRAKTHEVIAAYEMKILDDLKPDWESQLIPVEKMNFSRFLRGQQPAHLLPLCIPNLENARSPKNEEDDEAVTPQTGYITVKPPVGTPSKSSPQDVSGVPQSHLAFAARRNLEHLLSACTIQVTPAVYDIDGLEGLPKALNTVEAVAFTCGDMSGHRICWSSSL